MNVRLIALTVFYIGLVGCGTIKKSESPWALEKSWVRSTLNTGYLGYRRDHKMTPIVSGEMIVQANAIDGLSAYNKTSGRKLWQLNIKEGVPSDIAFLDDTLYFGASNGYLYSVDLFSGLVNWTFPLNSEGLGVPVVKGDILYIQTGTDTVFAINVKSGRKQWLYKRQQPSNVTIRGGSKPLVYGKQVIIGFSDGYLVSLNKNSGKIGWEKSLGSTNKKFTDVDAGAVLNNNKLYISSFDGFLYCLKLDGSTVWKINGGGVSDVTIEGKSLYYSTTFGEIKAIDKLSGKKIWSYKIRRSNGIPTQPKIYKSFVVFGESRGQLVVLNKKTGSKVTEFDPGRGVTSSPKILEQKSKAIVYFISHDANLFSLKLLKKKKIKNWVQ